MTSDKKATLDDFIEVTVLLTRSEWGKFRAERDLTAEGTFSAAIRGKLGLPQVPYGYKAALKREPPY